MSERMVQITEARFVELLEKEANPPLAVATSRITGNAQPDDLIVSVSAREYETLKTNAAMWRSCPWLAEAFNWWNGLKSRKWDDFASLTADAELGALVRQMPREYQLWHLKNEDRWRVFRYKDMPGTAIEFNTPEAALRAALEQVKP